MRTKAIDREREEKNESRRAVSRCSLEGSAVRVLIRVGVFAASN